MGVLQNLSFCDTPMHDIEANLAPLQNALCKLRIKSGEMMGDLSSNDSLH